MGLEVLDLTRMESLLVPLLNDFGMAIDKEDVDDDEEDVDPDAQNEDNAGDELFNQGEEDIALEEVAKGEVMGQTMMLYVGSQCQVLMMLNGLTLEDLAYSQLVVDEATILRQPEGVYNTIFSAIFKTTFMPLTTMLTLNALIDI